MNLRVFVSEFRLYLCNHIVSRVPSHSFRLWVYRNFMKFRIGKETSVLLHCTFDTFSQLSVGNNTVINPGCRLDNRGTIVIGDNVSISQDVVILTADHDMNNPFFEGRTKNVVIADYAWIGTRATILPGVAVGKGAVIAAGAVVTKDVVPYSVVAGVPAKEIGRRSTDLRYSLNYRRLFQ